jgi:hypothetical protein
MCYNIVVSKINNLHKGDNNMKNYLEQFKTKEEVKVELDRLTKEIKESKGINFNLLSRKNELYQYYIKKYCKKVSYIDDLGRTQFYYVEM